MVVAILEPDSFYVVVIVGRHHNRATAWKYTFRRVALDGGRVACDQSPQEREQDDAAEVKHKGVQKDNNVNFPKLLEGEGGLHLPPEEVGRPVSDELVGRGRRHLVVESCS